jgi:hypothetical protein
MKKYFKAFKWQITRQKKRKTEREKEEIKVGLTKDRKSKDFSAIKQEK